MAQFDPSVGEAWEAVLDDNTPTNWAIAGYAEDNATITLVGSGEGGFTEFMECLGGRTDQISWGGFRCYGIDDRGNTVSRRAKFIQVTFLSTDVPVMRRARAGRIKAEVQQVMRGSHVQMQIEAMDEIDEAILEASLRQCGGAHAPTSYEF